MIKVQGLVMYIPLNLVKELDECISKPGIISKSHLVQEALRLFSAEHRRRLLGSVIGLWE